MDDSWQFGNDSEISGHADQTLPKQRDDLEYVIMEQELAQLEPIEDEQLSCMMTWAEKIDGNAEKISLNKITNELSLDQGYFVIIKAIQTIKTRNGGTIVVGIGGPSGSGKSSLASRISEVFGGSVIDLETYFDSKESNDSLDLKSINIPLLKKHLQDLREGVEIGFSTPNLTDTERATSPLASSLFILDGVYALNKEIRPFLDIGVAVVGGVHYDLLQKVAETVKRGGEETTLAEVMDNIFPQFRTEIEPDLATAEIRISNKFAADSLREPMYIMKSTTVVSIEDIKQALGVEGELKEKKEKSLDMYLKPPGMFVKSRDLIRVRQVGSHYFYTEASQRIVDRSMIIRPKCEFEVGKTTLGGLLSCNYRIAVSFIRESTIYSNSELEISIDSVEIKTDPEPKSQSFLQIRGKNRQIVHAAADALIPNADWVTKSYMEIVCENHGITPLPSPPLSLTNLATSRTSSPPPNLPPQSDPQAGQIRVRSTSPKVDNGKEPWTRSPKFERGNEISDSWHLSGFSEYGISSKLESTAAAAGGQAGEGQSSAVEADPHKVEPSSISNSDLPVSETTVRVELVPKTEVFSFDRGLNMAVSAAQTLLKENGSPVIIGIGGPSGAGKSLFARQLANLTESLLVQTENYYKEGTVDETNYDEFFTIDTSLLQQNLRDLKSHFEAKIPVFDFSERRRVEHKAVELSRENGVVILEGQFALHPSFQQFLDIRISVIGGACAHLSTRVHRDLEKSGKVLSMREITDFVFPMFRENIEPHLTLSHLRIFNNFDPLHSQENSVFVLKSPKMVNIEDIASVLNPKAVHRTFQSFSDHYFYLPGMERSGPKGDRDFIRVRSSANRFSVIIREPIREGDFIVQSEVDFGISVKTVAGLSKLGYKPAAIIEVNSTFHQDDQLSIEVDHLPRLSRSYIQIKGKNKELVWSVGGRLGLTNTYTTMTYFEIFESSNKVAMAESVDVVRSFSAAKLHELVLRANGKEFGRGPAKNGDAPQPEFAANLQRSISKIERRLSRLETLQMISTINTTVMLATSLVVMLYIVLKR